MPKWFASWRFCSSRYLPSRQPALPGLFPRISVLLSAQRTAAAPPVSRIVIAAAVAFKPSCLARTGLTPS